MNGHLGHYLLDFLGQIWTQGTLRHILGPILVIFEICQFLMIPGPFEYFSENGLSQKIDDEVIVWALISLVLGVEVPRLNHMPICCLICCLQAVESRVPLF